MLLLTPAAWQCTLLVIESAVCDGEAGIALQSYRFACRIGPIFEQEQQMPKEKRVAWRDALLSRIGAAFMSLISGWLLDRVCIIMSSLRGVAIEALLHAFASTPREIHPPLLPSKELLLESVRKVTHYVLYVHRSRCRTSDASLSLAAHYFSRLVCSCIVRSYFPGDVFFIHPGSRAPHFNCNSAALIAGR
jgi:hypothetical protein